MLCLCQIIIFSMFSNPHIHALRTVISTGNCTKNTDVETTNGTDTVKQHFCCRHYEWRNNECKVNVLWYHYVGIFVLALLLFLENLYWPKANLQAKTTDVRVPTSMPIQKYSVCKEGYISTDGKQCRKCEDNLYGERCASICKCQPNERCDHVAGCTAEREVMILTSNKRQNNKEIGAGHVENDKKPDNVVIYMSCVAAIGFVLVIAGAVWKYRHTLWEFIYFLKTKLPIVGPISIVQEAECDAVGHNLSSNSEQGSTYDIINEKEMISFCKTE